MNLMSAAVKEKMLDGLWALVATALIVLFHGDTMQERTKPAMSRYNLNELMLRLD